MRLIDHHIIVTGSTNGIGAALARRFVTEGARVLVHGRDGTAGEELIAELGDAAALHIDDLSDPAAPARIVAAALSAFGRIDAVVNNAATSARNPLESTSAEFFDQVIATNLRAPLLLIQAAADELAKSEGAVLNIGTILAYCGLPKLLAYSISKGGLMTMTRNLALGLRSQHIRVNQMNIGWTLTPNEIELMRSEGLPDDWFLNLPTDMAPRGSLLQPEEVANAAVYWVGRESRPISGSVFEFEQYPIIGRVPVT